MYIIFINQQALFATIDKEILFIGLVPLDNRSKEQCYRSLDAVMRHYNKSGFAVKQNEYECELISIMDEVCNDTEIEMNY